MRRCRSRPLLPSRGSRGFSPARSGEGTGSGSTPRPAPRFRPGPAIELTVATFAQELDVPELVVSVRNFLIHVGVPREFVVVSDGTITDESKALIRLIRPGTDLCSVGRGVRRPQADRVGERFHGEEPLGREACLDHGHGRSRTCNVRGRRCVVLPARQRASGAVEGEVPLFMLDVAPYLDQRMLPDQALEDVALPVNAGMLFVPSPLDWTLSLTRLDLLDGAEPRLHRADGRTPRIPRCRRTAVPARPIRRQPASHEDAAPRPRSKARCLCPSLHAPATRAVLARGWPVDLVRRLRPSAGVTTAEERLSSGLGDGELSEISYER